jgi:hypothetical protein
MSDITEDLLNPDVGTEPLIAYPWKSHADSLIRWARDKDSSHRAFAFDFLMSLAYVDTVPNLQKHFAHYEALPAPYGLHLGFINLCAPLYIQQNAWHYQKAAKPQSGAIGKLTSEVILRFIEILFPNLERVKVIGGVGTADAILTHRDGRIILCEVKASPLTTYPFLFSTPTGGRTTSLDKLSRTQVQRLDSALYLHCEDVIPLGKPKDDLWPFSAAIPFVTDPANSTMVDGFVQRWREIRDAYATKDRDSKYYYVANASGHPPKIAKDEFDWPAKESISDSKTSAGMDRTDDIKKGVYQTFKLGIEANRDLCNNNIRTALISNLPAYRHGEDYVKPFCDVYWGFESSFQHEAESNTYRCADAALKRPFDYIIALEDAFMRDELL